MHRARSASKVSFNKHHLSTFSSSLSSNLSRFRAGPSDIVVEDVGDHRHPVVTDIASRAPGITNGGSPLREE
jgi:hypothetical protein